jgi:hypothetical protein
MTVDGICLNALPRNLTVWNRSIKICQSNLLLNSSSSDFELFIDFLTGMRQIWVLIHVPNNLRTCALSLKEVYRHYFNDCTIQNCHKEFLYNKTNQMHQFPKFTPAWNCTCFGQFLCPSSGVYSLYTRHWYMPYRFVDSFRAGPSWS